MPPLHTPICQGCQAVGACTKVTLSPFGSLRVAGFGFGVGSAVGSNAVLAAVPRMYETFNQTYGQHAAEVRPNREGGVR